MNTNYRKVVAEVVQSTISGLGANGKSVAALMRIPYTTWLSKTSGRTTFGADELLQLANLLGTTLTAMSAEIEKKLADRNAA